MRYDEQPDPLSDCMEEIIQALAEADQDSEGGWPGWRQERPHYCTKLTVKTLAAAYRAEVKKQEELEKVQGEAHVAYLKTMALAEQSAESKLKAAEARIAGLEAEVKTLECAATVGEVMSGAEVTKHLLVCAERAEKAEAERDALQKSLEAANLRIQVLESRAAKSDAGAGRGA